MTDRLPCDHAPECRNPGYVRYRGLCWPCWSSVRDKKACPHEKPLALVPQRFSDLELSYELRYHAQEMYGPREPWWGPLGEAYR